MSVMLTARLPREEINRKLLHLAALLMPAGIFYLPRLTGVSQWVPTAILGTLCLASAGLDVIRFTVPAVQRRYWSTFRALLRPEEIRRVTGATYIIGSAFLCSLIFYDAPHLSFMALTAFVLGDAAAALVGMRIGRHPLGAKTLEGTLACGVVCLLVFLTFPRFPYLLEAWGGAMPRAVQFGAPIGIALLELLPLRVGRSVTVNDNLSAPVLTALLIQMLYRIFG